MKSRFAFFITIVGVTLAPVFTSAQLLHHIHEQLNFSAEDDSVHRPIDLPIGVMEILRRDDYVLDILKDERLSTEKLPTSWFWASQVHLSGTEEEDVVVVGRCPICGANVSVFWIFRPTLNGFDKVLFTGALNLEIKKHRSRGYKEIETSSVTMQKVWTELWRFDGKHYQASFPNSPDAKTN